MPATTPPTNTAAWLRSTRGDLEVGPAPYTAAAAGELVVRNAALAVNPFDWVKQVMGDSALSWIKYPSVLGSDIAGEVVEVGPGVTRFLVGDRVIAHAVGVEKSRNRAAEGAFQQYTVVLDRLTSTIPDSLSYEDAVVLPLGVSTASSGLFQKDLLALQHPTAAPRPTGQTLLVWGGSTSVGSNAIQLAVAAGYEVIATASPRNFEYVRGLGASQVFDYSSPTVVADLIAAFSGKTIAGALAVAVGSGAPCAAVLAASTGRRFLALASPAVSFAKLGRRPGLVAMLGMGYRMVTSTAGLMIGGRLRGVRAKFIWGSSLMDNEVSTAVYRDFLPDALREGRYVAAPAPRVVGSGLGAVQAALDTQRGGVSAAKIVVTL